MEKVEEYVRTKYKRMFGEKPLIIEEFDSHYRVKSYKDESPLILSKSIKLN